MRIFLIVSLALLWAGYGLADELTIPNTFQAGTPARAADVNDNFMAVEASVDDNAADIATNVGDILSNAAASQNNGAAISANETAILANANAINVLASGSGLKVFANGNPIGRLVTFTDNNISEILIQSDTGYMFASSVMDGSYLREVSLWYSGTGCDGTLYIQAALSTGMPEWAGKTSGYVVRAIVSGPGPSDAYYVARESTAAEVSVNSRFSLGVCTDDSALVYAYEAFPNDEAITGVLDERPSAEFYIGMP